VVEQIDIDRWHFDNFFAFIPSNMIRQLETLLRPHPVVCSRNGIAAVVALAF